MCHFQYIRMYSLTQHLFCTFSNLNEGTGEVLCHITLMDVLKWYFKRDVTL